MTKLENEIIIQAPIEIVWNVLSKVDELENYDPTVLRSNSTHVTTEGLGASRKVEMKDGKNWFDETCTQHHVNKSITYELTACSFPIKALKHEYELTTSDAGTTVRQIMTYQMKYGLFGRLIDTLMVKNQTQKGIGLFFDGLKSFAEKKGEKN